MKRTLALMILFSNIAWTQEYSATYRVTFVGEWGPGSHPIDYPHGAHFSTLVGHTHNDQGYIWTPGEAASRGIEFVAETGAFFALRDEVNAINDLSNSESFIIGDANSARGMTFVDFEITYSHPKISLVSMIAPSPDWFVGVHGLNLLENNVWVEELMVDLLPYDAGTDSGSTFTSLNLDTLPPEPIHRIRSNPLPGEIPMGIFLFERLSVTGSSPDLLFYSGFE